MTEMKRKEVVCLVEPFITSTIWEIGSAEWLCDHDSFHKIFRPHDRSRREKKFLVSRNKVKSVIHEIMLMDLWKDEVFERIISTICKPLMCSSLYRVLCHEADILTLFESVLSRLKVCDFVGDSWKNIVDYCQQKADFLLQGSNVVMERPHSVSEFDIGISELLEIKEYLDFFVAMKAVVVATHLALNVKGLELCVLNHFLDFHDFPVIFMNLILASPWRRVLENGDVQIFDDSKWVSVDSEMKDKLPKIESQVWSALIELMRNNCYITKYEMTDYRIKELSKLKPMMTDSLIREMPLLTEVLGHLKNGNGMTPMRPNFVVFKVPDIKKDLLNKEKGMWQIIAYKQACDNFSPSLLERKILESFSNDRLSALNSKVMPPVGSRCSLCQGTAKTKCLRCHNEWYCNRKCQVKHWLEHVPACCEFTKNN